MEFQCRRTSRTILWNVKSFVINIDPICFRPSAAREQADFSIPLSTGRPWSFTAQVRTLLCVHYGSLLVKGKVLWTNLFALVLPPSFACEYHLTVFWDPPLYAVSYLRAGIIYNNYITIQQLQQQSQHDLFWGAYRLYCSHQDYPILVENRKLRLKEETQPIPHMELEMAPPWLVPFSGPSVLLLPRGTHLHLSHFLFTCVVQTPNPGGNICSVSIIKLNKIKISTSVFAQTSPAGIQETWHGRQRDPLNCSNNYQHI